MYAEKEGIGTDMNAPDPSYKQQGELREHVAQLVDRAKGYGYPMTTTAATDAIMQLFSAQIRAFADAVREEVIGADEYQPDNSASGLAYSYENNQTGGKAQDDLRTEQRTKLQELERRFL